MQPSREKISTLAVITAGICWGIISFFVRQLSTLGFDSFQIMCIRAWLSAALLLIYLLIFKRDLLKISVRDIWMFVGTGIFSLTFFSYCYFTTIVRSGAAVAVVLLYTSPIFVMLISAVVFGERITVIKVFALILTFTGCIFVAGLIGSGAGMSAGAFLLGLGAGVGYALYSIFGGFAVRKYSTITITFYTFVFSGITILFLCDPADMLHKASAGGMKMFIYSLGIALICTVVPYLTYTFGLKNMEKSKAAVIVTIEPVVGTILGILCYGEERGIGRIIGIVLILAALIILSLPQKDAASSEGATASDEATGSADAAFTDSSVCRHKEADA